MRSAGIINERDRLLDLYHKVKGEERLRILARLVVLDEEEGRNNVRNRHACKSINASN